MAVEFVTGDPSELLGMFNAKIGQADAKGKITTWKRSEDGTRYTHNSEQWRGKAWMKPAVGDGRLTFNIINLEDSALSTVDYGFYHGHLIETFLNHFDSNFTVGSATSIPTSADRIKHS